MTKFAPSVVTAPAKHPWDQTFPGDLTTKAERSTYLLNFLQECIKPTEDSYVLHFGILGEDHHSDDDVELTVHTTDDMFQLEQVKARQPRKEHPFWLSQHAPAIIDSSNWFVWGEPTIGSNSFHVMVYHMGHPSRLSAQNDWEDLVDRTSHGRVVDWAVLTTAKDWSVDLAFYLFHNWDQVALVHPTNKES